MKILTGTINELLNEVKAENNTNNSLQVESEVKSIIEKVKKMATKPCLTSHPSLTAYGSPNYASRPLISKVQVPKSTLPF